jgi:alcohol dehydrogenase
MGGAAAIIATANDSSVVSAVAPGLAPGGRMVILGVGKASGPTKPASE